MVYGRERRGGVPFGDAKQVRRRVAVVAALDSDTSFGWRLDVGARVSVCVRSSSREEQWGREEKNELGGRGVGEKSRRR